jgi:predicted Zn-dependent peptidase
MGVLLLGTTVPANVAAQTLEAARTVTASLAASPVSAAEFENARRVALVALNERRQRPEALADEWLDAITYNSTAADDERALNALAPADVQRVAARLFGGDAKLASIVVGDAAQLRDELARLSGGIEVAGAASPPPPAAASEQKLPKRP